MSTFNDSDTLEIFPVSDDTDCDLQSVDEIFRRRLAFYFMDPIQKYRARHLLPWKLILQFLKIIFVTLQVIIFGNYRYAYCNYKIDSLYTFHHLFLKDWDPVREIDAYPPPTGTFAIYQKQSFYDYLDFAIQGYSSLQEEAFSPISLQHVITLCIQEYDENYTLVTDCYSLPLTHSSSKTYIQQNHIFIPWETLEKMYLNFSVETSTTRNLDPILKKECFHFDIQIQFDNTDHDGQMPVSLDAESERISCTGDIPSFVTIYSYLTSILNYLVIVISFGSFFLCLRALYNGYVLKEEAIVFFNKRFGWNLRYTEKIDFLNIWYIVICINDILIITGSVMKNMIEARNGFNTDLWDCCSIFLGIGLLLVWIGMLRYLRFFKTYNVLILTLKCSIPNVLRFLVCGSLIYLGFVFCGWLILGPYHFKFKSIMSTSECLFSLVNGDDMFATFSSVLIKYKMIWIFSRIYLYTFISLFIYVILSLFIAIINDTYEVIKIYYQEGMPPRRLHNFYQSANYDANSSIFRQSNTGSRRRGDECFKRFTSILRKETNDN